MGSKRPTNDKRLGVTGLVLAVSSFVPYLGLLFLPAALVSTAALVRRSVRMVAVVALVTAFVRFVGATIQMPALPPGTPALLHRPYASLLMANYSLPSVPASATHIRLFAGGLFAKNVFLAFDVPERDARDFLDKLGSGEVRQVGPNGCRLLTPSQKSEIMEGTVMGEHGPDMTRLACVPTHDWLPWFRPDSIEVGWFASREDQDVTGFALYYDTQRSRAYFHWHYS